MILIFLPYALLKLVLHVSWCWIGFVFLVPAATERMTQAVFLGLVRLLLGVIFGGALGYLLFEEKAIPSVAIYWLIYVPVRWFEWGAIKPFISPVRSIPSAFLLGEGGSSRLWRLGGIVVFCLADLPLFDVLFQEGASGAS